MIAIARLQMHSVAKQWQSLEPPYTNKNENSKIVQHFPLFLLMFSMWFATCNWNEIDRCANIRFCICRLSFSLQGPKCKNRKFVQHSPLFFMVKIWRAFPLVFM
jgi:hypothetical protein